MLQGVCGERVAASSRTEGRLAPKRPSQTTKEKGAGTPHVESAQRAAGKDDTENAGAVSERTDVPNASQTSGKRLAVSGLKGTGNAPVRTGPATKGSSGQRPGTQGRSRSRGTEEGAEAGRKRPGTKRSAMTVSRLPNETVVRNAQKKTGKFGRSEKMHTFATETSCFNGANQRTNPHHFCHFLSDVKHKPLKIYSIHYRHC